MKRSFFILVTCGLLSACGPTIWSKPGGSQQDFQKDSYECQRDMRQSGYYGTGLAGALNMQNFGDQCMRAHGYTKQQDSRINSAGDYCSNIGLHQGQPEYWDCIDAVTANQPYIPKKEPEAKKGPEAESKKPHKVSVVNAEKQSEAAQIMADKAKCKEYGLNYGTNDFANCMIKLDQDRKRAAEQHCDKTLPDKTSDDPKYNKCVSDFIDSDVKE